MIAYRTDHMADVRPLWGTMAQVQTLLSPPEYIQKLKRACDQKPLRCTSAWDGRRCVGTMMYWPASAIPEAVRIATGIGIDPAVAIFWTNIHVHPEYRGRGVSVGMEEAQAREALAHGFRVAFTFGYETRDIVSWLQNRPEAQWSEMKDSAGDPAFLMSLSRFAHAPEGEDA